MLSEPLFHIFCLMNPGIVILEYAFANRKDKKKKNQILVKELVIQCIRAVSWLHLMLLNLDWLTRAAPDHSAVLTGCCGCCKA